MSIQQIPEKAVTTLRKRLNQAREQSVGPIDDSMKENELVLKFEAIDSKLHDLGIDLLSVKKWEDELGGHFTEMRRQIYKSLTKAKYGAGIISDLRLIEDKIKELNANNGAGINSDLRLVEDKIKEFNAKYKADINCDLPLVEDKIKELNAKNEPDINSYLRLVEDKIKELNAKNKADINSDLPLVEDKIKELNVALQPPPDLGRTGQDSQGKSSQSQKDSERKVVREWTEQGVENIIYDSSEMLNFQASYDTLEKLELKLCFLFFSVFPENAKIKKRPLIYWWIGEGLIAATAGKTAEEEGESIFQELIDLQFIEPYHEIPDTPSPGVNACKMHPWLRHLAIYLAQKAKLFEFDSSGTPSNRSSRTTSDGSSGTPSNRSSGTPSDRSSGCRRECLVLRGENSLADPSRNVENLLTVFNVSEKYLDLNLDCLSKLKKVEVLQLGAWHCSPKHHIEVEKEEVLRGLRALKHIKYLSLRGISLITTIPASIGELLSLEILDLKACHNLEELPSEIGSLTRLTHLDVSDCPFIESMPKELQNLTHLQVLKGFVIGNSKTSCRIDDLANLKELRRFGIVVGNEAVDREGEFTKLKEFKKLHSLTIWWGAKSLKQAVMDNLTFPPSLEKLDLRGTPHANPPKELKPSTLQKLKKLYIKGGKITRLDDGGTDQQWNVEILRLKYLNDFKLNWEQLLAKFPQLGFLDVKCDKGVKYEEDIVLKSRSEIENYCKKKVVEKNAMPAEKQNSEERKSMKKDNLGKEALVNDGKGKEVALKTEIEQEASTSY